MASKTSRFFSWRRIALVGLLAGGYQLYQKFEVEIDDSGGMSLRPRAVEVADAEPAVSLPQRFVSLYNRGSESSLDDSLRATQVSTAGPPQGVAGQPRNLQIASWAMGGFGPAHLADETVMPIFTQIVHGFDVLALQQVRVGERDFLDRLVARLNRDGRQYEYLSTADLVSWPGDGSGDQMVFLYDARRVVADRTQLYQIADPDRRLTHRPLVAWFRAAQVDPQRAWTFSLVNMHVELATARNEVQQLPSLIAAVQGDGRGEDDVVLAGLFQADHAYLAGTVGGQKYWIANRDRATDVDGRHQTSNLVVDRRNTTESLMRGSVTDFLRLHNLSIEHAKRVSPHLPVSAEFSPWEG